VHSVSCHILLFHSLEDTPYHWFCYDCMKFFPSPLHFSWIICLLAFNSTNLPIVRCFSFSGLPSPFLLLVLLKFLYCVFLYDCTLLASHRFVLFAVSEILSPHIPMSICFLLILKCHKAQQHNDHDTKVPWNCFNCYFILCMHAHAHVRTYTHKHTDIIRIYFIQSNYIKMTNEMHTTTA